MINDTEKRLLTTHVKSELTLQQCENYKMILIVESPHCYQNTPVDIGE